MVIKKTILALLFAPLWLLGSGFGFSVDDGAINVPNTSSFEIVLDNPLATTTTQATLNTLVTLAMSSDGVNYTNVGITLALNDRKNNIKINPSMALSSGMRYRLSFNASSLKDIYGRALGSKSVYFVADKFSRLEVFSGAVTIQAGGQTSIQVGLGEFSKEALYEISSDHPLLQISKTQLLFNAQNAAQRVSIKLTLAPNPVYDNRNYKLFFKETLSGFVLEKPLSVSDTLSLVIDNAPISTLQQQTNLNFRMSKQLPTGLQVAVTLSTDSQDIALDTNSTTFQGSSATTAQSVSITAKKEKGIDAIITLQAQPKGFNLGFEPRQVEYKYADQDSLEMPKKTIKALLLKPMGASLLWGIADEKAYGVGYSVYVSQSPLDYLADELVATLKGNRQFVALKSGVKNYIGVVADYTIDENTTQGAQTPKQKNDRYKVLELTPPKLTLKDANSNQIADDLEWWITKGKSIDPADSNNDSVPDTLQRYAQEVVNAKQNGTQPMEAFTGTQDTDQDGMPDLLEISVGRDPIKSDYLGDVLPFINVTPREELFVNQDTSLRDLSSAKAQDGSVDISNRLKIYASTDSCFKNGLLPYKIAFNGCQELQLKHLPIGKDTQVFWVVVDDDLNFVFRPQTIYLTKGYSSISYKVSGFMSKVHSTDSAVLFDLGRFALQSKDNNISLYLEQMPNIQNERRQFAYHNTVLDFKVYRPNGLVELIMPQVSRLKDGDKVRIYKNQKWQFFDEAGGDEVWSAKGVGKSCKSADNNYTKGITEGDYCLMLKMRDGSSNDADGEANGMIAFTGGVASATPYITFDNDPTPGCSSLNARGLEPTGDRFGYWGLVWLILIVIAWRRVFKASKNRPL